MKFLFFAIGAVLVLVVLVVLIGLLLPKHHTVTRSTRFHATPQQLFALVAGPQNWRPELAGSEDFTDEAGRRFTRETDRHKQIVVYELLDIDPPRGIQRRIATAGLPYSGVWNFTLQPADGGTTVQITEDGEVYNPVFRFVSRFILGHTASLDTYLRSLGKAIGEEVQPASI